MNYALDRFAFGGGLRTVAARPRAHAGERLTGLDGLRAIAVIAVFLFHADLDFARGGYLGVDLFFVISGFLITGLLAGESERSGTVSLSGFYWRRAKRLLPASWAMTIAAVIAAALIAPDALPRLKGDAIASIFYVTNWEMIFANTSYFEEMGRQPLLQHLWSLAIEEQFYILWAPVILFALPRLGRWRLAGIAAVLAVASAVWMAVLAAHIGYPDSSANPTRLYFGTDTHGFPLLIGAVLGLLWRPNSARAQIDPPANEGMFLIGLAALAATLFTFLQFGEEKPWLYPFGFLLSAGASATLIMAATYRGSFFGRWIDNAPMRWIGERSYGIYLWHWPIFMLTRPGLDLPLAPGAVLALRIALTLGISALCYTYLEQPIRQGALERIATGLNHPERRHRALQEARLLGIGAASAVVAFAAILVLAPNQVAPARDVQEALGLTAAASVPAAPGKPVAIVKPLTGPAAVPVETFTGEDLTAIGDSVLLGSSRMVTATLVGAKVYATVGWQAANVLDEIRQLHDTHALTPVVLIHLGTNGYVTEDQLRAMLSLLADRKRVIMINSHVPRRWQDANNELIDRVVPDYPNVVLADWRNASESQPDYFVSDGVHLTIYGQRAFVAMIAVAGHLTVAPPPAKAAANSDVVDPSAAYPFSSGDLSKTLVRVAVPAPADSYWLRMARCESGGNWQTPGEHAGGLGITAKAWAQWGGSEFAPTAAGATPAQQIAIANRIAATGWKRPDGAIEAPVGFAGWACLRRVGKPPVMPELTFTPESVLAQQFHLSERGDVVRDLESMLGLPRDGIYGRRVQLKHLALLKAKGLPEALAGSSS